MSKADTNAASGLKSQGQDPGNMRDGSQSASTSTGQATKPAPTLSQDPAPSQQGQALATAANESIAWAFLINLLLLIVGGTWVCVWLIHYTDKFDDFAKVLALGGGLTWVAFVLKVLREERLEAFQRAADRFIFSNWIVTVALLIACFVGLYSRRHLGTVQVELFLGKEERILKVQAPGRPEQSWRVAPGDKVRVVTWTSWEKPALLYVKVSGYPDLRVPVKPLERRELRIPSAFMRRVILLKPTVNLIVHRTNGFMVSVKTPGQGAKTVPFIGHPIWIGADKDVDIPQAKLDAWRQALPESARSDTMAFLQMADALTDTGFDLNPKEPVCIELIRPGGSRYLRKDILVRPIELNQDYVQEEEIDVRSEENSPDPPSC